MLSGNYKFYYLFYLVFFCSCYISCVKTTKENTELTREEVKELIDVEVKQYLDSTYKEYNVYSHVIKLIDTNQTTEFIKKFEDTSEVLFSFSDHKVHNPRRIPFLDSILWKNFNVSKLELTDSIQYEFNSLKKTIGISKPYYIKGYYLVQFRAIWKKSSYGFCGTGIPYCVSLFYQKVNGEWVFQFDEYEY